jgi:peptidoglycan/LPS O-acetylase OafA/YrhL
VTAPSAPTGAVPYDVFRERRHFPALDGLRALSIAVVIWEHCRNRAVAWWSHGMNGVVLFFVLSGFLITSLCLREESKYRRVSLRAFATRRAFRILPLYYCVLGFYTLIVVVLGLDPRRPRFLHALPYYALFLQEVPHFQFPNVPFEVAWSLGVEEKFYLLWPLVAFFLLARIPRWRAPIAAGLALLAGLAPQLGPWGNYVFYEGAILWGCVVAMLLHDEAVYERVRWIGRSGVVAAALLLAVAVHMLTQNDNRAAANIVLPMTFAVAIGALVTTQARWTRVFDARPLAAVGIASYVIYLIHQLFLKVAEKAIPARFGVAGDIATLLLGAGLAIGASLLIHRWFEEPVTAIGRRLSRAIEDRTPAGARAPAATRVERAT